MTNGFDDGTGWHRWFAWYPTHAGWLRLVWRRERIVSEGAIWEYSRDGEA